MPDPEACPRRLPVGRRRRHRSAGDHVASAVRDPRSGTPGTRASRTAPAAGWSARDGCRPRSARAALVRARRPAPTGPATYPPAPSTASGAQLAQDRAAPRRTAPAAISTARAAATGPPRGKRRHAQPAQLVARGRHELGLGAVAADERDLGALSPQRVGDRQRRHDVPRGPAGADHDPRRCQLSVSGRLAAAAPGRAMFSSRPTPTPASRTDCVGA